jgi:hypothetical protein
VDEGGDDEARAGAQRGENLGEERPRGKLRFPRLYAGPRHFPEGGRWYLGASPSKKSVRRIKTKVSELLTPGTRMPGLKCKLDCYWAAGRLTSPMAPSHRCIGPLAIMSMIARVISYANPRCRGCDLDGVSAIRHRCGDFSRTAALWLHDHEYGDPLSVAGAEMNDHCR